MERAQAQALGHDKCKTWHGVRREQLSVLSPALLYSTC